MAINFTGEFDTPRNPEQVFDFLSDPKKFAGLFPDFEGVTFEDETHFTVKLRVSVGNLKGSAEVAMELAESVPAQRALYRGTGTAVGSQIAMSAGFDLSAQTAGSRVAWQGEVNISGKLASLGGMLEPVVKKNLQRLIASLQWALYTASPQAASEGVAGEAAPVAALGAPGANVATEAMASQPAASQYLQPLPTPAGQSAQPKPGEAEEEP